jgi:hypothetical protein
MNATSSVVRYRAAARAGSWPIGDDLRDILGCEGGRVFLYGINASLLEDNKLGIPSMQLRIFVNGVERFTISPSWRGMLKISHIEGSTPIEFKGYRPFNKES